MLSTCLSQLVRSALSLDYGDLDSGVECVVNERRREIAPRANDCLESTLAQADARQASESQCLLVEFFRAHFDRGVLRGSASQSQRRNEDASNYEYGELAENNGAAKIDASARSRQLPFSREDAFYVPHEGRPRKYAFRLPSERRVVFELSEGKDVHASRKPSRIVLEERQPPECDAQDLRLSFVERLAPDRTSQAHINRRTCTAIFEMPELAAWRDELSASRPSAKRRASSRLEHHLSAFTADEAEPRFIHRDLGRYLRHELDALVQRLMVDGVWDLEDEAASTELLRLASNPNLCPTAGLSSSATHESALLDELAVAHTACQDSISRALLDRLAERVALARLVRRCGRLLIGALAELEEIRKRHWLRRPLVLEGHWCVTLDRVPADLHVQVVRNAAQLQEWRHLFALDALTGGSTERSLDVLKTHPNLVVDTRHFDQEFTDRLLASFDDLDRATDGLAIHGDSFRALRLLEPRYTGSVKCAAIDPPYNTGSAALSYPDRLGHAAWLAMMQDWLKLTRKLLRDDGALFVMLDDHEQARLRMLLEQTFGERNFVATIVWEKVHTRKNSARHFSVSHDYILACARNKDLWRRQLLPREQTAAYTNSDADPRGPWKPDPVYANKPYDVDYQIEKPNGVRLDPPAGQFWRFSADTFARKVAGGEMLWGEGAAYPLVKRYLADVQDGLVPVTLFTRHFAGDNGEANAELNDLFGPGRPVAYPKPTRLIERLLQIATAKSGADVVLDFFAGSGTTAQAVMAQNDRDGGRRKYVLVEMGPHFDTVLRPRLMKAMYSRNWRAGQPVGKQGRSHLINYVRIESYEDSAEAISESDFHNPLRRELANDKDGLPGASRVDLVASFNFLLGLRVRRQWTDGGLCLVRGEDSQSKPALIAWRNVRETDDKALWECVAAHIDPHAPPEIFYVNCCRGLHDDEIASVARRLGCKQILSIEREFERLRDEN